MKLIKNLDMRDETTKSGKTYKRRFALFHCEYCHKDIETRKDNGLKIDSCGCMQNQKIGEANRTHGDTLNYKKEKLYSVWQSMIKRCNYPKVKNWHRYGGRGISVCKRWRNNYELFRKWALSNGYAEGLYIDRENNNGNYTPFNCRFVTPKVSAMNKEMFNNPKRWRRLISKRIAM